MQTELCEDTGAFSVSITNNQSFQGCAFLADRMGSADPKTSHYNLSMPGIASV